MSVNKFFKDLMYNNYINRLLPFTTEYSEAQGTDPFMLVLVLGVVYSIFLGISYLISWLIIDNSCTKMTKEEKQKKYLNVALILAAVFTAFFWLYLEFICDCGVLNGISAIYYED